VDIKTSFVRYLYTGEAMMIMASLQDVSCNSDVTYFPFDNHACAIQLLTMEYWLNCPGNILQTVFKIYGIIEDSRIAHITYA
jgi:hypothetical protein